MGGGTGTFEGIEIKRKLEERPQRGRKSGVLGDAPGKLTFPFPSFQEKTRDCFQATELAPNQFLHSTQVTEGCPRDPQSPTRLAMASQTWRDRPHLRVPKGDSGAECHTLG